MRASYLQYHRREELEEESSSRASLWFNFRCEFCSVLCRVRAVLWPAALLLPPFESIFLLTSGTDSIELKSTAHDARPSSAAV